MMKRLLLAFILITPSYATGPIYPHKDTVIKLEFDNVYKELEEGTVVGKKGVSAQNLQVSVVSDTSNHVLYDWIALTDDDGNIVTSGKRKHNILTGDITNPSPGGLDTGSESSNTWYAIHVISDDGTNFDVLYSTTANKPTLPNGYPYWGHVGWVRNDGSSHFRKFIQDGNFYQYKDDQTLISQATGIGTNTTTALAGLIPPFNTAWAGYFWVYLDSTYTDAASKKLTFELSGNLLGSYTTGAIPLVFDDDIYQSSAKISRSGLVWSITDEDTPQIVWYAQSTSANRSSYNIRIEVRGFMLNLFD